MSKPSSQPLAGAGSALLILTALNLLNYIDRYVPSAVKELVKVDLNLTDTQTALPLTSFVWVYMLASPVFGALADRVSRPKLIAAGVLLWSLATAGAAFCTSFTSFLIARSLVGVGEAAYATLAPAMLSDLYPADRRNAILTRFYIAIPVGSALGFVLGGVVGNHYGWQAAFLVAGLPGIIAAAFAWRLPDPPRAVSASEPAAPQPSWGSALRTLAVNRPFVTAVAGYTAVTFASGALADWYPSYLHRSLGMDVGRAGLVVGGTAVLGGIGGTIVGGLLGDRLQGRTRQPYLALSAGSMTLAVLFTAGSLLLRTEAAVIACILCAQFFMWCYNGPINAMIANATGSALRARAFALSILTIHLFGDSISPTIVGRISDVLAASGKGEPLALALWLVPIAMATGAAIWAWGWRRLPSDPAADGMQPHLAA
ncbi:MAG: MFS transporter [Deltaproteobacteria bacterium]|nr:MFS transporter [Deltaproteobacteria bacterium]